MDQWNAVRISRSENFRFQIERLVREKQTFGTLHLMLADMRMLTTRPAQAVLIILVVGLDLAMADEGDRGKDQPPTFKITTKRDSDKVDVKIDKEKALFSIHSPFGISQATIERTEEKWPNSVAIRLHLKGLSSFRSFNGKVRIDAAVAMPKDKLQVRIWKDGQEDMPLDAKSPYWINIQMVGADGKTGKEIPLKDGYFELRMPQALFESNPKSITIHWIDFYRN
jgi:hypothetical protein